VEDNIFLSFMDLESQSTVRLCIHHTHVPLNKFTQFYILKPEAAEIKYKTLRVGLNRQ